MNTTHPPKPTTSRNEIYDNFLPTCYSDPPYKMSTLTVYAVAVHRSFDNYFARFVGFSTSLQEIQSVFTSVATELAALEHGKTLTFRRPYVDHRTPDEFVVLRYDVPVTATQLHVQYIRWKYAGLTMSASTGDQPAEWPDDVNGLSDCVYNATWFRPVADPEIPTPPPSKGTAISV